MIPKFFLTNSLILFFLSSSLCVHSQSDSENSKNNFSKFTCEYLTMDYPSSWMIQKEKNRLLFYLPEEPGRHMNSPGFHLTFQSRYGDQNPIILFESEKDFPTQGKEYFQEEIAGHLATAYRSLMSGDVLNIRYWFDVAPKKKVMIHISGYSDHVELHWPLFEKVKKSIQLIKQPPPRKGKIIEVTSDQLSGEWQEKNIAFGSMGDLRISKFEKVIRELNGRNNIIRITDKNIDLTDWNSFFSWKPFSNLKDVQIYSYYRGVGDQLDIFSHQVYLGNYDFLHIQQLKDSNVQFDFTKSSGEKIRWILNYEDDHNLVLNDKIELNRFTFKIDSSFQKPDKTTGKVITFAINGEKYTLRVKSMQVF